MIEAHAISPLATLSPALVTRKRPLLFSPPSPPAAPLPVAAPAVRVPGEFAEDLRFFLTCYVAGLLFFLVMLS